MGATSYARSGPYSIAYRIEGSGPQDLVVVPPWVSHIDMQWEHPRVARFYDRLASFSRLIVFDKRGTGLSDRVPVEELPSLEERMDDIRAVMDAAESEEAAILGFSEGVSMAVLFAATYPDRCTALVLSGGFACRRWHPDYPWAPTPEQRQAWIDLISETWGSEVDLDELAPSAANDPSFREWFARYLRASASPGAAVALARMNTEIDIRHVLPTIRVPTLVLHRTGDRDASVEEGRFMASQIPGARFVEQPGLDHLPWAGNQDELLAEVEAFLTGSVARPDAARSLATVLFTDIVASTEMASTLGDREWTDLLERHARLARQVITRFEGEVIKFTGDGLLAIFAGPARAIRCALALSEALQELGVEVRAGLHTGEIERLGDDIGGIAVHIAARVMALAGPGEVFVSRTVRDLIAGSQISLVTRGVHQLKGVEGDWEILAVA